jgi:hypothetical protein
VQTTFGDTWTIDSDEKQELALDVALEAWRAEHPDVSHLDDPTSAHWCGSWVAAHFEFSRDYVLARIVRETEAEMARMLAANPDLEPVLARDEAAARVLARRQSARA